MNSQKRRIVGFILVLALLLQSVVPAFATEYNYTEFTTEEGKVKLSGNEVTLEDYGDLNADGTFYYVAVGDSVTAGMGTKGVEEIRPLQPLVKQSFFNNMFGGVGMFALENYKNCAKDSYPYLVAEKLFEALKQTGFLSEGTKFDYDTHDDVTGHDFGFSNMGLAAYEVNDVVDAIINPKQTAYLFSMFADYLLTESSAAVYLRFDDAVKLTDRAGSDRHYDGLFELYNDYLTMGVEKLSISDDSPLGTFIQNDDNLDAMLAVAKDFGFIKQNGLLTQEQADKLHTAPFNTKLEFAINLFVKPISRMGNYVEFYIHDILLAELKKADVVSFNLGSNDLLTQFLMSAFDSNSEIGAQKLGRLSSNKILNVIFSSLSSMVSWGDQGQDEILENILSQLEDASLTDLVDVLTFLDSENIRKELEVYAVDVINGYRRFVDIMRNGYKKDGIVIDPINPDAKIVFVGTINPFGTNLELGIFDENQEFTGKTKMCDLPSILDRVFQELKSAVAEKTLYEVFTMLPAGGIDFAAVAAGVPAAMTASVAMGVPGNLPAVIDFLLDREMISSNPALYFDDAVEWAKMANALISLVNSWTEDEKANLIALAKAFQFTDDESTSLAAIASKLTTSMQAIFTGDEFEQYISQVVLNATLFMFSQNMRGSDNYSSEEAFELYKSLVNIITTGAIDVAYKVFVNFAEAAYEAGNTVVAERIEDIIEKINAITVSGVAFSDELKELAGDVYDLVQEIYSSGDGDFWKGAYVRFERDFAEYYKDLKTIVLGLIVKENLDIASGAAAGLVAAVSPYMEEINQYVDKFYNELQITYGKGYAGKDLKEEIPALVATIDDWRDFFNNPLHQFEPAEILRLFDTAYDVKKATVSAPAIAANLRSSWQDLIIDWAQFASNVEEVVDYTSADAIGLCNLIIHHYADAFVSHGGFLGVWNQMSTEAREAFNFAMMYSFIHAASFAGEFADLASPAAYVASEMAIFAEDAFSDWTGYLMTLSREEADAIISAALEQIYNLPAESQTIRLLANEFYSTLITLNNYIFDAPTMAAVAAVNTFILSLRFISPAAALIEWSREAVTTTVAFVEEGGVSPVAVLVESLASISQEDIKAVVAECSLDVVQRIVDGYPELLTSPAGFEEAYKELLFTELLSVLFESGIPQDTILVFLDALDAINYNLPSIEPVVDAFLDAVDDVINSPYFDNVLEVVVMSIQYIDEFIGHGENFNDIFTSLAGFAQIGISLATELATTNAAFAEYTIRKFRSVVDEFFTGGVSIAAIVGHAADKAWVDNYAEDLWRFIVTAINVYEVVSNYIDESGLGTLKQNFDDAIEATKVFRQSLIDACDMLTETAGIVVDRTMIAARLTSTFADAGKLFIDSAKTVKSTIQDRFGDLLGDAKSWTKFIADISKDPVTFAKVVACLLTEEDLQASAAAILTGEELTFPLIYLIFGETSSKPIQEMNSRLDKLAKEYRRKGDNVEYVDIYDVINESNFDPHPLTANQKLIADKIAASILDDISIKPLNLTLKVVNADKKNPVAEGSILTLNGKANLEVKAGNDYVIESVKLNGGKNLNTGLFTSDKSYKDTIAYKDGYELVVTFKTTKPVYTVTLDPNGGSLDSETERVIKGEPIESVPTWDDYHEFLGWFTAKEGGEKVTAVTADQPVYAHWQDNTPVPGPTPPPSGSSGPREYTVTLDPNGGNLADKEFVGLKGDEITAVPTKVGYNFLGWFTAKEGGSKVEKITKSTTLYAHWELSNTDAADKYIDVNKDDWFYESVQYLTSIGAMDGIDEDEFGPLDIGTRAQVVQVLYNIQGCPAVSGSVSYPDVKKGDEWYDAVLWGTQNNVVLGYDNGNFGPEDPITREQLAAVLMRYTGDLGLNNSARADITSFKDYKNVSDYATDAMRWAVATKLIKGNDLNQLNPGENASRSEIAAILQRYAKTVLDK